jgi:prepilin-type N-terminal cleavage/methylation domain-containing protein
MRNKAKAFTLVELLIVIVVIGILAGITIVAYNGFRTRAQIASVSDGLTKVGKSMKLWVLKNDFAAWPEDPVVGGGTPLLTMIQNDPTLRNYLQTPPTVTGVQSEDWFYDNEGDEKPTDCQDTYSGVNIVIRFVTDVKIAQGVDNTLDDGNLSCGKVRYVDQRIFYTLSNVQAIGD